MNNALVALNIARPTNNVSTSSATGHAGGDAQPSKGFDSALDAARSAQSAHAEARRDDSAAAPDRTRAKADSNAGSRADARANARNDNRDAATKNDGASGNASTATSTDDSKPAAARSDAGDEAKADDGSKKDDNATAGSSLATAMLALIGVPPTVTALAGKALSALKDATGKADTAIGGASALGLPATGAAATAEGAVGAAKDALLAGNTADAVAQVAAPAVSAVPFAASLLSAKGGLLGGAKDDVTATDPTTSPMPLTHNAGLMPVDGPAVQVQATQAATSPQFTQELGEQISWMGAGDIKEARIKLHPEELGSMDVRVNMDGGKVNIAIIAQHPAAVHAVQQTLSQLDTMLAHHGLSLGQADVGQRDAGQGTQGGTQGDQGGSGSDDPAATTGAVATSRVSRSLVDEVA
jgi:flagellar hook-length control protein FliK